MNFQKLFKKTDEKRLKVLMLADRPGWTVNNVVDRLIEGIPCDFTKDYYSTIEPEKLLEISSQFDLIYYSNTDISRHLEVLGKIKTPILLGVRSHRYANFVKDLPQIIKKYNLHVQVINTALLKEFTTARYIPNGIDAQFKPVKEFIVGFVGVPDEYKGFPLIQQACDELGVKFMPATGNIHKKDMHKYYVGINLLVSASVNEGFANPVMEAMAMNVPVISTETGAVKDYNITIVERSVEGIKNGISKFYTSPQVEHLTWENSCKEFFNYFQDIVSSKTGKDLE